MQKQPLEASQQGLHDMALATGDDHCILTTYDRDSGMAHDVQMRFALQGGHMYMLSDEGGDAQWVRNLLRNPEVSVRVGSETFAGMARAIADGPEAELTRHLLATKYEGWRDGQPLSDWASSALPVVIDLAPHHQASAEREAASSQPLPLDES